ncbi:MAG: glycosyltransferase family 4 protein [Magnetococcales bacterium]|nr:glycosyltransferase family 4 protein [Magnetococcales bacterium]
MIQASENHNPMRICLIVNQIAAWGKIGGFGVNARRLGRGLVAQGVEVHVVVPQRAGQDRLETLDGMTIHGQSSREVFFGRKIYRQIDADIYHLCEPNIAGFNAQRACPDKIHLVTSMNPRNHEVWRTELASAVWSRKIKIPFQWAYEDSPPVRRAIKKAHGVYAEAEFLRDVAQDFYRLAQRPGLLPKPVPIPEGPFQKSERPLCVFLGRFDGAKRPERFFQLVSQLPEVDFIAIGRSHEASHQKHLEERYFHLPNLTVSGDFIDQFQDNTLDNILARAWILVHTGPREGLATSFQEASAREMAILAYVNPGNYVRRFGKVVPDDGGTDTMAAALQSLIHSGGWRKMGKQGRAWNLANHSVQHSVEEHMKVYRGHLEQQRGG